MLTIGLTGGIGCGKTTVSQLFKEKNVPVVDADEISHAIVQTGQPALVKLANAFGQQILLTNGALNREYLRELVFAKPNKKALLESILHPIIYRTMDQQLNAFDSPYGMLSIPLLFETKHQENIDRVLVIDCSEETQITRVKARDQLSDSMIGSIMDSQCSREFRLSHADDILNNDGTLEKLKSDIDKLHSLYLKISTGKNHTHPAK
ncbi:MAG: dephospho-CoA kinase [Cycloclasticus sp.]